MPTIERSLLCSYGFHFQPWPGQPLPMRFRVSSGLFILRPTHYTSYKAGREATAHRKLSSPRQCGRQGTIVSAIHPLPPSANKCMISIFKFFF
jgi:hypothetical protein